MYTIDTSVFVNAYDTNEDGHAISRAFLDLVRTHQIQLTMPELLLPEVAGALARTRGDSVAAIEFTMALRAIPHAAFAPLDAMLGRAAAELAARHRLRGADSMYAASRSASRRRLCRSTTNT